MAKRRREKDEEEEKPFKLPKFDEEAFLKRERRNVKATFISFLFGILMAFICFGFWALMGQHDQRWLLVLLVCIVSASFIKYIFLRINLDMADFTKKNWFGSYITYFFSWLIIFIIIVNPPFYDDEAPLVDLAVLPDMQEPGGNVTIVAKITDNAGLEKQNIQFELTHPDSTKEYPVFDFENNVFNYTHYGPNNLTEDITYNFKLTAEDHGGHKTIKEGSFTYSENTIYLALPESGDTVKAASYIRFGVGAKVSRVYYTVNDGKIINATKPAEENYYTTSPAFQGWPNNKNVTVNVTAEIIYYFENIIEDGEFVEFRNTIVDTTNYNFTVADESTIGLTPSPEISLPGPRYVLAPGFEVIIFLISLVVVVLIFKKRKRNRSNQK